MMKDNKMQITITGMVGKRKEKAELKEAAEFFAAQLMDPRMVRNLMLDIDVIDKLDVDGECVSEDDTRNPRWFTISLKRDADINEMIKVLGHEMVHVKQYAKNELGKELALARGGKGLKITTRWQGKLWYPKSKEHAYFDCPWEIEAYGREIGLFYKWTARNA
jgi:hypothetical protein